MSNVDPLPPFLHRLWASGKLETRLQLVQYRERGIEPQDLLIMLLDVRCTVAQEVFMAILDDEAEIARRIATVNGSDEPATAPVVVPMEMGRIVVAEIWPNLLVELVGKPAEAVAVLTVASEEDVLLSYAEVEVWGRN